MKTKFLAVLLLAGMSLFARVHFSIGVGIGVPYGYYYGPPPVYYAAPPVLAYAPPPHIVPGYSWVGGYWRPVYRRHWVRPYYRHRYYYRGRWRR